MSYAQAQTHRYATWFIEGTLQGPITHVTETIGV